MTQPHRRWPCPCCGHLVHEDPPGSHLICPICFWEDDGVQLRWPLYKGGANKPSLVEAQLNFLEIHACEQRLRQKVRKPQLDEPLEQGFRVIDLAIDSFEENGDQERPWPDDRTVLYWWRPTFWRSRNIPADK
ncbi:CPCC family cysteine-rich protein [Actinomycetes bacterium KLBMP 9797]